MRNRSRLLCLRFKYKNSLLLTLDKIIGIIILISLHEMYNEIEVTKLLSSIQFLEKLDFSWNTLRDFISLPRVFNFLYIKYIVLININ